MQFSTRMLWVTGCIILLMAVVKMMAWLQVGSYL